MPTIIDLEWQTQMHKAGDVFIFAYSEKKSNMLAYEGTGLCQYIKDLFHSTKGYHESRQECRNFLRTYFMERAQYCDTSNRLERVRKAVYQNPSEDVLDAEILRLMILKNHEKQFTYLDKNIEKPRDMLEMVRYQGMGNFAAKQLAEFQPQRSYSEASRAEDEYFEAMREFGRDWHYKTQSWYKSSIDYMKRLVTGEERQDSQSGYSYCPNIFGNMYELHDYTCDKTELIKILPPGAKIAWDNVQMGITSKTLELEGNFVKLKKAIDTRDIQLKSSSEKSIKILTEEIFI